MSAVSAIPTETVSGCVIRMLYHGTPHLVFIQHTDKTKTRSTRAVFEVQRNGPGGYKPHPKRQRLNWTPDEGEEATTIALEYLNRVTPT